MRVIKQKYKSDCGVAALAMALSVEWLDAYRFLHRFPGWPAPRTPGSHERYLGVDREHMIDAVALETKQPDLRAHGTRTFPPSSRGVMFVHGETEWADTSHWLAWESDERGAVTLVNPTDGESFPLQNLHVRGFRMVEWLTVKP